MKLPPSESGWMHFGAVALVIALQAETNLELAEF
jgi:hypothetical protein